MVVQIQLAIYRKILYNTAYCQPYLPNQGFSNLLIIGADRYRQHLFYIYYTVLYGPRQLAF